MNTFHKVVTRVTDKKVTITYAGEVQAEQRPENTFVEKSLVDIYEDYFLTKEEAELFIRTEKSQI